MKRSGEKRPQSASTETKKCPQCYVYLTADAVRCYSCGARVGKRGNTGLAERPINWKAYTISFFAWVAFALYIWWAFFRE